MERVRVMSAGSIVQKLVPATAPPTSSRRVYYRANAAFASSLMKACAQTDPDTDPPTDHLSQLADDELLHLLGNLDLVTCATLCKSQREWKSRATTLSTRAGSRTHVTCAPSTSSTVLAWCMNSRPDRSCHFILDRCSGK